MAENFLEKNSAFVIGSCCSSRNPAAERMVRPWGSDICQAQRLSSINEICEIISFILKDVSEPRLWSKSMSIMFASCLYRALDISFNTTGTGSYIGELTLYN